MRPLLVLAPAFLLAACGSQSTAGDPTPTPVSSPSGATASREFTEEDMIRLVYWDHLFEAREGYNPAVGRMVAEAATSGNEALLPFLLDLVALPIPYGLDLQDYLIRWLGDWGDFFVFGWHEARGFLEPDDDTETYLRFKRHLIGTIQLEMGAFLDPAKPRTISAQEIMWGGVGVDGIPPLEEPAFVTHAEATAWINDSDEIIGVEINGDARAYPRRIIDWHEMVNDTIGGIPVSLAYCTLCNSAILYDGRAGDKVYRFGTSGMLYRSNKLMYDRTTRTLWGQYTGEPVWGDLVGQGIRLSILPVVHTTYGEWRAQHPDTLVLDVETGFARDYDPGAAYRSYWASDQPIFPVPNRDASIHPKSPVFTVRLHGLTVAYPITMLAASAFVQDEVEGTPIVVFATADGSGGRAYESAGLEFTSWEPDARVAATADGRSWLQEEHALVANDGQRLERVPGHNSFWFAVTNHTDRYRLFEGN
jgi:hypothetical protein